jgi:hypothetical protein
MYKMSDPVGNGHPKTGRRVNGRKRTIKIYKPMNQHFTHEKNPEKRAVLIKALEESRQNPMQIGRTLELYYAVYDNEQPMEITRTTIDNTLILQKGVAILKELKKSRHPVPQVYIRYLTEGLMTQNYSMVNRTINRIEMSKRRFSKHFISASELSKDINNIVALFEPRAAATREPRVASGEPRAASREPPSGAVASGATAASGEPRAAAREPPSGVAAAAARVAEARAKSSDSNIQTVLNALWFAAKHIYNPKALVRNVVGLTVFTCALWGASAYHGNTTLTGRAFGALARTAEHASIVYTGPANYVLDVATSKAATVIEDKLCNPYLKAGFQSAFTAALWADRIQQLSGEAGRSMQLGFSGFEYPSQEFYLPTPQTNRPDEGASVVSHGFLRGPAPASVIPAAKMSSSMLTHELEFTKPSWVGFLLDRFPQEGQILGACVAQGRTDAENAVAPKHDMLVEEARSTAFRTGASVKDLLESLAKNARSVGEDAESAITITTTVAETLARIGDFAIALLEMVADIIPEIASTFAGGGSRQNKITRKYKNVISRGTKRTHRRTQYTNWRTTRKLLV